MITIPDKPTLATGPQVDDKCYRVDGNIYPCVWFTLEDMKLIRQWYLNLERELKAACLAFGHSKTTCKAQ